MTVLAPGSRVDLALPTDLIVAELVPMLCELVGESGAGGRSRRAGPGTPDPRPTRPIVWCLAAVAGAELPPEATLAGLGVLDGDLLRLRPRSDPPPPPVFDDPVDAVAAAVPAVDGNPGPWHRAEPLTVRPWDPRCRRAAGLTISAVAILLAAVLLGAVRGPGSVADPVAAVIGGLATAAALIAAGYVVRLDAVAGALLAAGAVPLAAAAGFAALPGTPGAGHLLLAAALAAAAGATGLAVLGTPSPPLVAAVLAATLCAAAALLAELGAGSTAGLAAAAATVAVGALPLLPRISIRLAGLPPPVVPTTPAEMMASDARCQFDSGPGAAEAISHHARLAHSYLGGLVSGAAAVAGVGAALAASAGPAGPIFAAVVVAVLVLRSRAYATALSSGAPLAAGVLAGAALALGLGAAGPQPLRLAGGLGLLVAGAASIGLVWAGSTREPSPPARRSLDVLEAVLVAAIFPLALWVLDLYHVVQGL